MLVRLTIPKLAASPVEPLRTAPRFRSELLRSGVAWPQDVNYLRDVYMGVYSAWEAAQRPAPETPYDPAQDKQLYEKIEPMLRELILGMEGVAKERSQRTDIFRSVQLATYDFETAGSYGRATDYAMALVYLSYAMLKLHKLLDSLTLEANKKISGRKLGYGYDISGEGGRGGGTSGEGRHLWDTGNAPKHDHTQNNPANMMFDAEAESDFPELAKFKHKRVHWPPRTR